jgi:V8-like Glu-specific endopeptidase
MATDSLPEEDVSQDVDAAPRTDGGSLEIKIGAEDDTLGVGFLLNGAISARSVAKLRVHRHFNSSPSFKAGGEPDFGVGTGWMIGPNLLVTNYHVLNARVEHEPPASKTDFDLQAAATEADFDYHDATEAVVTVPVRSLEVADAQLDYALLRLDEAANNRPPLRLRANPLTRHQGNALQERVNVLQHPDGDPMRLGFRNNFVVTGSNERLSYLTDTAGGSSGSPICDDAWYVAGLHRGWSTIRGEPVDVWGTKISQENYGTPIGLILGDLAKRSPGLHAEIAAGQSALG